MRSDPLVGAPERGQHTRPFDRERTVLAHRAVADRHGGGRLAGAEPIPGELIVQRPGTAHWRALAARLAGAPERIVGSLAQVDAEAGQIQVVMNRIGVDALIEDVLPPGIGRDAGPDPAQGIDGVVLPLKREAARHHLHVGNRGIQAHDGVVRLGEARASPDGLRQALNRRRQTGLACEQHALLGDQLAPRIPGHPQREHSLHVGEVRLRLMADAGVGELVGEVAEVLREHPHRRGVEQVLAARA